jgi:hypothetical protein
LNRSASFSITARRFSSVISGQFSISASVRPQPAQIPR